MQEWLDIKNEPLDPNEIQVLLAASQEFKVSLKNLNLSLIHI